MNLRHSFYNNPLSYKQALEMNFSTYPVLAHLPSRFISIEVFTSNVQIAFAPFDINNKPDYYFLLPRALRSNEHRKISLKAETRNLTNKFLS